MIEGAGGERSSHFSPPFDDAPTRDLLRIARSDAGALHDLYNQVSAKLFGVCLRVLQDRSEAEDALQETFLAVWRKAHTFDPSRGSATAWLLTLTRNCAVDRLRARTRGRFTPIDYPEDEADETPIAPDLMERRQEGVRLERCIELLAAGDATLIRTAFYQGTTYSELASRVGRPLGTVKSRIRRALLKLADCLA